MLFLVLSFLKSSHSNPFFVFHSPRDLFLEPRQTLFTSVRRGRGVEVQPMGTTPEHMSGLFNGHGKQVLCPFVGKLTFVPPILYEE